MRMEHIYTPWRMQYFDRDKKNPACAFCEALKSADSDGNLVVARGERVFVILNLYPYTSGHLMVVPNEHCSDFSVLDAEVVAEMMRYAQKALRVLTDLYQPQGFNMGINLGAAAGAGIAAHLHLHIVPRWGGDANFMSVIGDTRVIPEAMETTYLRVREAWNQAE
jgi:ATP adenylyltransferase